MNIILKDNLNISDCIQMSMRLKRSRSRSNHNKSDLSVNNKESEGRDSIENPSLRKSKMSGSIDHIIYHKSKDIVAFEDKESLPRVWLIDK